MKLTQTKNGGQPETIEDVFAALKKANSAITSLDGVMTSLAEKQDKITSTNKLSYNLLKDTPIIPTVPTNLSSFNNDAGFITDISGKLDVVNGTATNLTVSQGLELKHDSTPYIDFHYQNSTDDYTSRIIEQAKGQINIIASNGVKINGTTVDLNKLTTENITLSVNENRLTNMSYTAKYCPLLDAVFVRIYGKINVNMNLGYDYDVLKIESKKPVYYVAALATKVGKSIAACAKTNGMISLRPLTENISASAGWDIYITGFWFVSS